MSGHHPHASEMPFKWRFPGGLMIACLNSYLDPLIKKPSLAKLSGSPHEPDISDVSHEISSLIFFKNEAKILQESSSPGGDWHCKGLIIFYWKKSGKKITRN